MWTGRGAGGGGAGAFGGAFGGAFEGRELALLGRAGALEGELRAGGGFVRRRSVAGLSAVSHPMSRSLRSSIVGAGTFFVRRSFSNASSPTAGMLTSMPVGAASMGGSDCRSFGGSERRMAASDTSNEGGGRLPIKFAGHARTTPSFTGLPFIG